MNADLLVQLELQLDIKELKELGLSQEEVEGYLDFFLDNYFPPKKEVKNDLRVHMPEVWTSTRKMA